MFHRATPMIAFHGVSCIKLYLCHVWIVAYHDGAHGQLMGVAHK